MSNANWRGIVGGIKPSFKSGSLVDFIHLLPDGVGVVPLFIGAREHTEDKYLRAMEIYHQLVGELAQIGIDLIHSVAAGVWSVLKHLGVPHPIKGSGRLLEQFP